MLSSTSNDLDTHGPGESQGARLFDPDADPHDPGVTKAHAGNVLRQALQQEERGRLDLLDDLLLDRPVVHGVFHGVSPAGGRLLTGRVFEARLYDRALNDQEVLAATTGVPKTAVTNAMLLAEMSSEQKQQLIKVDRQIVGVEQSVKSITQQIEAQKDHVYQRYQGCFGLAHALLNSKEFVYVY